MGKGTSFGFMPEMSFRLKVILSSAFIQQQFYFLLVALFLDINKTFSSHSPVIPGCLESPAGSFTYFLSTNVMILVMSHEIQHFPFILESIKWIICGCFLLSIALDGSVILQLNIDRLLGFAVFNWKFLS